MSLETVGIALEITYNSTTLAGLLQDASGTIDSGFTAEARNRYGQVSEAKQGDFTASVDVTMIAESTDSMPGHGDIVTVSGFNNTDLNGDYHVSSIGETHAQQDYKTRDFTLNRYLDNGVTASKLTTTTTTTTTT